ncbi:MAG: hypothetical protein ACKOW8_04455, partial [Flavobacteriales bacterium]
MKSCPTRALLILGIALFMVSCSERITKKIEINNLMVSAEGPLFEGPNTLQATHVIDWEKIEGGIVPEQIESVKITKADISSESDTIMFDGIRNMVLQITGSKAQMQKLGVVNPLPSGVNKVQITPSADADLAENFKHPE